MHLRKKRQKIGDLRILSNSGGNFLGRVPMCRYLLLCLERFFLSVVRLQAAEGRVKKGSLFQADAIF